MNKDKGKSLQLEQEKSAHDQQLEASCKQLEAESMKCSQLEQLASWQKAELIQLWDHTLKYDWEVKQLESKQDKTIVEHVHVLKEAKHDTNQQLTDTQMELQKNAAYIHSLKKLKTRLTGKAKDLSLQNRTGTSRIESQREGCQGNGGYYED